MNFLKQVINLLDKYEQKLEFFDEADLANTTFHKLYDGVKSGKYSTDEEACGDIYQLEAPDARYRNLKSRLKKKLAGNLFFLRIEQPEHSEYLSTVHDIFHQVYILHTLGSLGASVAANEVAEQIFAKAQKFHLTNAAVDSLLTLRKRGAYHGQSKEYLRYSELLDYYIRVQSAEIKASSYIESINIIFTNTKSDSPGIIEQLEHAVSEVSNLSDEYKSHFLFLTHYRLSIYLSQLKKDSLLALQVCNTIDEFYHKYPHLVTTTRIGEIALDKTMAYFYLRRYREGVEYARPYLPIFREGGNTWFTFRETFCWLLIHGQCYTEAREVYEGTTTHISFDTGIAHRKETWQIFGLYLAFVEGAETPDMDKFMKDMEVYRADKSGAYVTVLALSILVLLRKGDYDSIITRDEYLKKYLTRYLRGEDHARGAAFFKLLRLLAKNDFSLDAVKKYGEKHIAVLYDASLPLDDYEVMPYERMWEYVVETLTGSAGTALRSIS